MGRLLDHFTGDRVVAGVLRPPGDWQLCRYAPDDELADRIAWIWVVRWALPGDTAHTQRTLPHPSAHVVVEDGRAQLHGPRRRRFVRTLHGRGRAVAIRFVPGGLRPTVGEAMAQWADVTRDATTVFGGLTPRVVAAIEAEPDDRRAAERLEAAMRADLRPADAGVREATAAVARIAEDRHLRTVDDLAASLGTSRRSLQRLFTDYVGVGVKTVVRRYRLQELAAQAEAGAEVDWAALAVALGYYDQSHLIRDFREIVGTSPARYAATTTGS